MGNRYDEIMAMADPTRLLTVDGLLHATGGVANREEVLEESRWSHLGAIQNEATV